MKYFYMRFKALLIVMLIYVLVAVTFYWLGGEQLHKKTVTTDDMVVPATTVGEITKDAAAEQPFSIDADRITGVTLLTATYARANGCTLTVSVRDAEKVIVSVDVPASALKDNGKTEIAFPVPAAITPGERLTLVIASTDGAAGNAATVFYGSGISVSKGTVEKKIEESEMASFGGKRIEGVLCFQAEGDSDLVFGRVYWRLAAVLGVLLAFYGVVLTLKSEKRKPSAVLRLFSAVKRYRFLMQQLVNRDFKAKYKRSILGVCWSFLNPLLTMSVQYVVFSTLFKSNIKSFPLYLLTGIVCFNFFSEATNMCLQSITGNAGLITKVYVPKYIYPVTRVMSSTINLMLSFIPLIFVMVIMKTPFRPQNLLIVFGILCLEALCLGMGLILASSMVFFRDTQFIWGVLLTILNFATPIFYPVSIIPAKYMTLYKMNPLYHIVRFMRIVLMDGVSPEPKAYLLCMISVTVPLLLGIFVFRKSQDKFVLYI